MDTSKHIFQLHGVNTAEEPVLRKKLRRKEMFAFLEKLAPTVIAIEACGASHHCARLLQSFGHSVKLIAPQLVKPYIKRGKNDAADAEALCEAMSRPGMRFVPVKTAEQQAALMLVGVRDRLIRNRTQLSNAIRGYAGEFGLTAAKGKAHLAPLLQRIHADESLPALARELFAAQAKEYVQLQAQIDEVDARLMTWHRAGECSRRLTKIPGVGPIGADLIHAARVRDADAWRAHFRRSGPTRARAQSGTMEGPPQLWAAGTQHLATLQGDAWVAAGDAACAWDPLSSAGILKALRTGRLAAFVALDAMQGRLDTTQRYTRILRREHAAYLEGARVSIVWRGDGVTPRSGGATPYPLCQMIR